LSGFQLVESHQHAYFLAKNKTRGGQQRNGEQNNSEYFFHAWHSAFVLS
jgi:hypothetical protein